MTDLQHRAGAIFESDRAAGRPRLSGRRMERVQGGDVGFSMGGLAAARGQRAATKLGPLLEIVDFVCCKDGKPSEWAVRTKRRPEEGMAILKLGLDVLVLFYGLGQD